MLALKIALRYLFSEKTHGAVNVISAISVVGVAIATMAIVIVLSVFNGFSDLAAAHLSVLDPDLKITPAQGKVIDNADSLAGEIGGIDGIKLAIPTIDERALIVYGKEQMPVVFKGVAPGYDALTAVDNAVIDGYFISEDAGIEAMQLSVGVALTTGARPSPEAFADIYVPRREGRINPANPSAAFRGEKMPVSGVFQVDQPEYDADRVIIPLSTARRLLGYSTQATAIEVAVSDKADAGAMEKMLTSHLGEDYIVLPRIKQHEQSFRMIAIEKWVTFLMLSFILVVASFNIISTMSLLVIEKRDNMATLRALGAPGKLIRRIFMIQGWMITITGGIAGIILGVALSMAQQWGHFIKLSADPSALTIDSYPVRVDIADLLTVMALVTTVGLITSQVARVFKAVRSH